MVTKSLELQMSFGGQPFLNCWRAPSYCHGRLFPDNPNFQQVTWRSRWVRVTPWACRNLVMDFWVIASDHSLALPFNPDCQAKCKPSTGLQPKRHPTMLPKKRPGEEQEEEEEDSTDGSVCLGRLLEIPRGVPIFEELHFSSLC